MNLLRDLHEGRVFYKGGGGGSAGSLEYPAYQEDAHQDIIGNMAGLTDTLTAVMNVSLGSNPYTNISFSDPASLISTNESRYSTLETLIGGLDESADWNSLLTDAVGYIDALGVLNDIDINALATAARSGANDVATAVDGLITLTPIDPDVISTDAHAEAATAQGAAIGTYVDWSTAVDEAVAKILTSVDDVDIAGVIASHFTEIDLATLLNLIEGRMSSIIADVISDSLAAVDPTVLTNLVDSYVQQRAVDRARIRTRYKATAAFQGAERSSAYAIGLALLDTEFSRETGAYQSQANLDLYSQGIQAYNNILNSYLRAGMEGEISDQRTPFNFAANASIENKRAEDRFVLTNIAERLSNDVQKNGQGAEVYVQAFRDELTNRLRAEISNKSLDAEGVFQTVNSYVEAFRQELNSRLRGAALEKQTRDTMIAEAIMQMLSYKQFITQMQYEISRFLVDLNRVGYVMDSEYTGNTSDLEGRESRWDMSVLQDGSAVLGALGGATYVPDAPSKVSSALGGTLSGAGVGAAIGTALGGPGIGTAVGGVIGGLAGLFS